MYKYGTWDYKISIVTYLRLQSAWEHSGQKVTWASVAQPPRFPGRSPPSKNKRWKKSNIYVADARRRKHWNNDF